MPKSQEAGTFSNESLAEKIKRCKKQRNSREASRHFENLAVRLMDGILYKIKGILFTKGMTNVVDVDETANDVLRKAYNAIESYNPEFKVSTWIGTIARNETLNAVKRYRRRLKKESLEESAQRKAKKLRSYIENYEVNYDSQALLKKAKVLFADNGKSDYFNLLVYLYIQGCTLKETAFALGLVDENSSENEVDNAAERVRSWRDKALELICKHLVKTETNLLYEKSHGHREHN